MIKYFKISFVVMCLLWICTAPSYAGDLEMDKIKSNDPSWQYFSDQVMGGRSEGFSKLLMEGNLSFIRMQGLVTIENNGGFIQIRSSVGRLNKKLKGLELKVRGNGERYYVFIRTTGTILPWQYYKANFQTKADWSNVQLRFNEFQRSSAWLRKTITPDSIKSIGIVAFGRNHKALIDVAEVTFF